MTATKISGLLSEERRRFLVVGCCQAAVVVAAELCLGAQGADLPVTVRVVRGLALILTVFGVHVAALHALSSYRERQVKGDLLIYALLLSSVLLVSIGNILSFALISYANMHDLWRGLTVQSLALSMPFALPVLIARSILGLQLGLMVAIVETIIMGAYAPAPGITAGLILTTSIVACVEFVRVRSRSAYLRAAFKISVAALPFAVISLLMVPPTGTLDATVRILGCLVSGGLSGIIAVGLTPVVEYLSGYASDMRLIELATLDHPLLKDLSVQAPGTWNHSMVIGMMVESAADAIGANPVVCRVGAYFHDVGKVTKPLYFVENQNPGDNRHDKLNPSMSALIIRSHVKEGVELARKHRLPLVIEDLIAQHHGTSMIEYFFEKARKEAEDCGNDPDAVDRGPFSYPGPKPQTREAGLLMLADGIEAATRTLGEPSFDRIQGLVQKMINKVFATGELNECDLTLRDLHVIAKCFTRVLSGIYHQRIAYAEPAEKTSSSHHDRGVEEGGASDGDRKDRKRENLKRLGVE
jgi:putative nucleotidyltransferase with HDIG domain